MLTQEILKELELINYDFNDKCDDLYGFKYETNGYYEAILFGEHVLWDGEDLRENEDETVIECVKRRFNDFLDDINQCRYTDVPISARKKSTDIYDAFDVMIGDLSLRGLWVTSEITDFWLNTLKKYIPFGSVNRFGADKAVDEIIDDLTDRKGLRQGWYNMGEDVQEEIKNKWIDIINSKV